MEKNNLNLINLSFLISLSLLVGFISSWRLISFNGLSPNLVLLVLISALFSGFSLFESTLIFFAGFTSLAWSPVLGVESLSLIIIASLLIISRRYLNLVGLISLFFIITLTTILFYICNTPSLLWENPQIIFIEVIINIIFAVVLIGLFRFFNIYKN